MFHVLQLNSAGAGRSSRHRVTGAEPTPRLLHQVPPVRLLPESVIGAGGLWSSPPPPARWRRARLTGAVTDDSDGVGWSRAGDEPSQVSGSLVDVRLHRLRDPCLGSRDVRVRGREGKVAVSRLDRGD